MNNSYQFLVNKIKWKLIQEYMVKITKSTSIEDLVNTNSEFVDFLWKHGIRCIRCGEPIMGTFEEAAIQKGFNQEQILHFVEEMNQMIEN
jgi:hypothetical protein